ncbi:MAG: SlyX family protein [Natronospirillum sp.]
MDIEQRLADLEVRLAFSEDTIEQLSTVIGRQDAEIRQLTRLLERFSDQVSNLSHQVAPDLTDNPPPHY